MAQARIGIIALSLSLFLACPAYAIAPADPAPKWAQLNSEQQAVLAPLAKDWDDFTDFRKKKWIGIAKRYPTMRPDEQQHLQTRMREWASLTQQQRRIARENFKKIDKLPPEKKLTMRQKWEEYQRLPEAEKRKLAELGSRPPPAPVLRIPRGAGKAAQPIPKAAPAASPASAVSPTPGIAIPPPAAAAPAIAPAGPAIQPAAQSAGK